MPTSYAIGDLVFDEDYGVGVVKRIYFDDNAKDGIIYHIWWVMEGECSFEYFIDLIPLDLPKGG